MAAPSTTPVFVHDCDGCVYLGHHADHDLWFCAQHGRPTVIARASSDGPDYVSGLPFADVVPSLGEARRRARARGLLVA